MIRLFAPIESTEGGPARSAYLVPSALAVLPSGDVLIGEVSTVNDDETDNVFEMDIKRFGGLTEDVAPVHLLVSDYKKWLG